MSLKGVRLTSSECVLLPAVLVAAGIGLYAGWRLFWFLTDDAFIAFRYVSNSVLGYGYVWNPPPFRPVEGYTSFLWVALLDGIWRVLGLEPPESANWVSLIFSGLTLLLIVAMVLQIRWHERLRPYRIGFLALVLLGTLTNRTFLAWTSSGLETAMFDFFIMLWLYAAVFLLPSTRASWVLAISTGSAAIALTRPDGYLFMAAAVFMLGITFLQKRGKPGFRWVLAALPMLLPVAHILWRKHFYGEWLPNTYHAKRTTWWPESGLCYANSFVLEYALWFWFAVVGTVAIRYGWPRLWRSCRESRTSKRSWTHTAFTLSIQLTPLLTVATYILYYTIMIGGDHFEYRVYSYLTPLLFIALAWAVNSAEWRPVKAMATMLACIILSWPVPWTHWVVERRLKTDPRDMVVGPVHIRQAFPPGLREYASAFDWLQDWLIKHYVCVRHHGHRFLWRQQIEFSPSRAEGLKMSGEGFPVLATKTAGVLGWVLPKVNIIDCHGLNDYVVARTPHPCYMPRRMAHERYPPPGYVESFEPNVTIVHKQIVVTPRRKNLRAKDLATIDRDWAKRVTNEFQIGSRQATHSLRDLPTNFHQL